MKNLLFPLLLGLLLLPACSRIWHIADVQPNSYRVTKAVDASAEEDIRALISPYKEQLDAEMNQVLGRLTHPLEKAKPESTLGNWMCDMLHKKSEDYYQKPIDFTTVNYGGIRLSSLPAGDLTVRTIFELMPFDNQLVVLRVDSAIVHQLFERMAANGGWPISQQVSYRIVDQQPQDIRIKGQPLQGNRTYYISISDFIANGGGRCFFLRDQPRDALGKQVREGMIDYLREETAAGRAYSAAVDGRVKS